MFESLLLVAILTMLLWTAVYGFYLYTSRRHKSVEESLASLETLLQEEDAKPE